MAPAFSSPVGESARRKSDEIMVVGEREQCGVSIAGHCDDSLQRATKANARRRKDEKDEEDERREYGAARCKQVGFHVLFLSSVPSVG